MKGMQTIFKKEMARVFKDPKMIFSLFILPLILMIGIYGIMGMLVSNMEDNINSHQSIIYVQNLPGELHSYFTELSESNDLSYIESSYDTTTIKEGIYNGTVDLLIVFPDAFLNQIEGYEAGGTSSIPDIHTFYNPSEDYSSKARSDFQEILYGPIYNDLLAARIGDLDLLTIFTLDAANEDSIIQDDDKAAGKVLGMMLPYLITLLLFSGTMSLGSDSIAGEKERGTMASMLVTPVKRTEIVLGKLLSLTVLSILSAAVYVIGMVISTPFSMSFMTSDESMSMRMSIDQILMIACIMILLAFLYVALVCTISVYAKTIKEAQTYMTPVYLVVIVAGLFTIMGTTGAHETYEYLIPVYNSALALGEVFSKSLTMEHFLMVIGSTAAIAVILSAIIAKTFNNEKIMFNA